MKEQIKKIEAFLQKNKKKIYIIGGTAIVVFIGGKVCMKCYKLGFNKGYTVGWAKYQESYLKDIVPDAYKLVLEHITNHPEEYVTINV